MAQAAQSSNGQQPPVEIRKYMNLSNNAQPVRFKGANSMYNKPPVGTISSRPGHGAQTQPINFHQRGSVNQSNSFGNSSTSVSGGAPGGQRQNSAGSQNSKKSKNSYLSTTHSMQQKKTLNGIQKLRPGQQAPPMMPGGTEPPSEHGMSNRYNMPNGADGSQGNFMRQNSFGTISNAGSLAN